MGLHSFYYCLNTLPDYLPMDDLIKESDLVCQIEHEKDSYGLTLWVGHTFKHDLEETIKVAGEKLLKLIKAGTMPKSMRITDNQKALFSTTFDIKKPEL